MKRTLLYGMASAGKEPTVSIEGIVLEYVLADVRELDAQLETGFTSNLWNENMNENHRPASLSSSSMNAAA